jgi:hypothetical protein
VLWQQVFQAVMCVLCAVLCATECVLCAVLCATECVLCAVLCATECVLCAVLCYVFNKRVHLLVERILMLSKCTLRQ